MNLTLLDIGPCFKGFVLEFVFVTLCETGCWFLVLKKKKSSLKWRLCPGETSLSHILLLFWTCRAGCPTQTQKNTRSCIYFKFAICSIGLLSLDETCHLKGCDLATVWRTVLLLSCYDCDSTYQHYDFTRFEYILWRRMNGYSTTICKLVDLIPALHQSDCRISNWVSAKTVHSSSTNHGQTTARFRSFFR